MPTFDIPGRVKGQPYTVTLTGREGQRLSFGRWPYTTEDPAKIEALDGYCFVQRVPEPEPAPQPAPQPDPEPAPQPPREAKPKPRKDGEA